MRRAIAVAFAGATILSILAGPRSAWAQADSGIGVPLTLSVVSDTGLAATVDTLLRESAAVHPVLQSLRFSIDVARARADASGRRGPASLSIGLSEAPFDALEQGNLRLEAGRELGGTRRLRAERALADVDVREAHVRLDAATNALSAALVHALVSTVTERRVVERLSAEDALMQEAEQGLRSRFAVGEARYIDVLRVRTERIRILSERTEAVATERASRARLAYLLAAELPGGVARMVRADSLARSADLVAWRSLLPTAADSGFAGSANAELPLAEVSIRRAEASRNLGVLSRRPRIEGFAGVQRMGDGGDGATLGPSIGFTLSLPWTSMAANDRAARADRLEVDRSMMARLATAATVRGRVTAAREHYIAALERVDAFESALLVGALAEREGALSAYRSQQLTLLELLDFERALARAEIDALRALAAASASYVLLVTGGADSALTAVFDSDSDPRPER